MATPLDEYAPFDAGPGADVQEAQWRKFMKHMLGSQSGVIRGFDNDYECYGDSSGMQVKVKTGQCWIQSHWGATNSEKTLAIDSADPTNPRKDRVVLRADFGNNRIELEVLTGTPAVTPTVPAVTQNTLQWETSVAIVSVAAGATTVAAADVTDDRVYTSAHARFRQATAQSIPNITTTKVNWDTTVYRSGDVDFDDTSNDFTLKRAGLWTIVCNFRYVTSNTGMRFLWISKNGEEATDRLSQVAASASGDSSGIGLTATTIMRFAANEVVAAWVYQSSGAALNSNTTEKGSNISFVWVGP